MQGTVLPEITRKGIMEAAQDCGYEVNDYTLSAPSGFVFFIIITIIIISSTNACWVPVDSGLYSCSRSHSF